MEITDKSAIVTGGSSGMGFAAAKLLADKGMKVTILGRQKNRVEERADEIGALGLVCDISDYQSVQKAFEISAQKQGTAQVLVNAAGNGSMMFILNPDGSPAEIKSIEDIIQTNLTGTLYVAQTFASQLIHAKETADDIRGIIINVSSIGGLDSSVGSPYVASKGGVNALTLSLAREFAPWKIRVMTIAPGGVDTEMLRNGAVPETWELISQQALATQRAGTTEEFAKLTLDIIENDYLNGSIIRFDSGMRLPYFFDLGGGAEKPDA